MKLFSTNSIQIVNSCQWYWFTAKWPLFS